MTTTTLQLNEIFNHHPHDVYRSSRRWQTFYKVAAKASVVALAALAALAVAIAVSCSPSHLVAVLLALSLSYPLAKKIPPSFREKALRLNKMVRGAKYITSLVDKIQATPGALKRFADTLDLKRGPITDAQCSHLAARYEAAIREIDRIKERIGATQVYLKHAKSQKKVGNDFQYSDQLPEFQTKEQLELRISGYLIKCLKYKLDAAFYLRLIETPTLQGRKSDYYKVFPKRDMSKYFLEAHGKKYTREKLLKMNFVELGREIYT